MYVNGKLSFCNGRMESWCRVKIKTAKRESLSQPSSQWDKEFRSLTLLMETDTEHPAGGTNTQNGRAAIFLFPLHFAFFNHLTLPDGALS